MEGELEEKWQKAKPGLLEEEVGVFENVTRMVIRESGGAYPELYSGGELVFEGDPDAWATEIRWKRGLVKRMKVGSVSIPEPPETVYIYDFVDPAKILVTKWYDLEGGLHYTVYVVG